MSTINIGHLFGELVGVKDLAQLLRSLTHATKGDNRFDVNLEMLVPLTDYVKAKRINFAGTKIIRDYADKTHSTSWADDYSTQVDAALRLLREALPDWWLVGMGEDRSPASAAGDTHRPLGTWFVRLQHVGGGRLTEAHAATLPLALCAAIVDVKVGYQIGRWVE